MGHTVHAWLEDEDRSGAATGLAAVTDQLINTLNDNLRFRSAWPMVALMYLWTEFAAYAPNIATITSASIAQRPWILTKGVALNYLREGQIYDFRDAPMEGPQPGEDITVTAFEEDEGGVAHFLGLVVIVSDGSIPRTPPFKQITHIHRCTVGATSAAAWSTLTMTEINALEAGEYVMRGARVESATAVAARFILENYVERPAVIPVTLSTDMVHPFSRDWGLEYKFKIPDGLPQLEMLTTAAETPGEVELYLEKVA